MNKTSALRPLTALAASGLLLGTAAIATPAEESPQQSVASAVGTPSSCEEPLPDNPARGLDLGPQFYRAV